jgi:hypothetical protein
MKFNKPTHIVNHEWWKAVKLNIETELIKLCLTSFLEKTFYETQKDLMNRLDTYINNTPSDFILKLAIFSRNYWLRSINHYLTAKWILIENWKVGMRAKLKSALMKILRRPDEFWKIIKTIEYIKWESYIPNSLKNVIKDILASWKFDEYQISKYKSKWDINLYDLVNMTHPKWEIFNKLMTWTLKPADTWEVWLSTWWDKKETFTNQLQNNKLWTKAMLMNMRNMIESWVDQKLIQERLKTANMIWIFPFEVMKVMWYCKETKISTNLLNELENIAYKSFENLPLEWNVAVLVDTSWSMHNHFWWEKSTMEYIDIGAFYWALVLKKWYDLYAWADYPVKINKIAWDGVLRTINDVKCTKNWYWINLQEAIDLVKDNYDNVLVFSDMQTQYYIKDTWKIKNVFLFNLSQYQWSIAIKWNMIKISWFSDIMFKLWLSLKNINPLIEEIKNI